MDPEEPPKQNIYSEITIDNKTRERLFLVHEVKQVRAWQMNII